MIGYGMQPINGNTVGGVAQEDNNNSTPVVGQR